jgi:hypothetical protein
LERFGESTPDQVVVKIATGTDPDARQWLQSVLDHAKDTPEKRALLELLAKP